jgi:hypothetical protein
VPKDVDEIPEKEKSGSGRHSNPSSSSGRRMLDLSANAQDYDPPEMDEMTDEQKRQALEALGPVERTAKGGGDNRRKRGETVDPRGEPKKTQNFDPEGAIPLWMERQRRATGSTPNIRQGLAGPPQGGRFQTSTAAIQSPPPPPAPTQPNVANVNIHNQTDLQLLLLATHNGKRVSKDLFPKQTLLFAAPLNCELVIRDVKSRMTVLKHHCVDPQTTLVVSDSSVAKIVGGSGHWYDNRVLLAAAGAGSVLVLLLVVALGAYAVHRLAKNYASKSSAKKSGQQPPNNILLM